MQPNAQMKPPEPLDLQKYLQQLNIKLGNMKRQNAQQLGILVQTQSEQIGRQHDGLIQEIGPLVQEVGRLQLENEELKKQLPKPPKAVIPEGNAGAATAETVTQGNPPTTADPK